MVKALEIASQHSIRPERCPWGATQGRWYRAPLVRSETRSAPLGLPFGLNTRNPAPRQRLHTAWPPSALDCTRARVPTAYVFPASPHPVRERNRPTSASSSHGSHHDPPGPSPSRCRLPMEIFIHIESINSCSTILPRDKFKKYAQYPKEQYASSLERKPQLLLNATSWLDLLI
jgi:hypothetical protein